MPKPEIKHRVVAVLSYLFILLFVYAAVSKLLDFETFETQLAQSPLLSAFAKPVAIGVPAIELLIALLLMIKSFRLLGLFSFFCLMVMFTAYIIIILNFTDFVPCSCGGVLEDMGWTEHLIFNIGFILVAGFCIYLLKNESQHVLLLLSTLIILSSAVVTLLYVSSEKQMKRNNAFVRRYVPHPVEKIGTYDLQNNTYYISGLDREYVYLGNYNAPLLVKQIDILLSEESDIFVKIDSTHLPYRRVKISVNPPYFYLGDGTVPILFRGKVNEWNAKVLSYEDAYFTEFVVADSVTVGVTTRSLTSKANALGLLSIIRDSICFELQDYIIKGQSESGTFDSEGMLLWNDKHQRFIYVYFFRNRYEITNHDLIFQGSGKTIDTISKAIVDVALYHKKDAFKLGGSSVIVNKQSATYGDFLFIHSDRLGRYEEDDVLRSASIIDVYSLNDLSYEFSFYLYHQRGERLGQFRIYRDNMIALVGDKLWIYRLKSDYFKLETDEKFTVQ